MVPDVVKIVLNDYPLLRVMQLRRTCKSFSYGIHFLLNERLQKISERDFKDIKRILEKDKKRYLLIGTITNIQLKITVAMVHASGSYILWDRNRLKDVHDIQDNITSFTDFLVCRFRYAEAIIFENDETLRTSLISLVNERSREIQSVLEFGSKDWITNYTLRSIRNLIEIQKAENLKDNDHFYLALHSLFIDRSTYNITSGIDTLERLAQGTHTLAQWVLGEFYFYHTNQTLPGLAYMRKAANSDDLFFTYRLVKFLIKDNKSLHKREVQDLLKKAMDGNYRRAFYRAGLIEKNNINQAREYFEKGAALGCKKSQAELDKLNKENSCVVQ